MNFTSPQWPAELGREENRGRLKDLVGPPQLRDLTFETLDLSVLLAAHPDPLPGVDLSLAHPDAQGFRAADTQLGSHRLDCRPLRLIALLDLANHADGTLPQLGRVRRSSCHAQDPIAFSTDEASRHAGGIHSTSVGWRRDHRLQLDARGSVVWPGRALIAVGTGLFGCGSGGFVP